MALVSLAISPLMVHGTEGQVNVGGKISFYEEETIPDETTPIVPDEPESSVDQNTGTAKKTAGNLPSTGELTGNFGFIGIGLILLFLLLVVLRRWTKEEK